MELGRQQLIGKEAGMTVFPPDFSLINILDAACADKGDKTAICDRHGSLTFKELRQRVETLAGGLHARGIVRGMTAIVQMPNTMDYVLSVFALFRLGVVPLLTPPAYRLADLERFCEAIQPAVYFAPGTLGGFNYADMAQVLQKNFRCLKLFVSDHPFHAGSVAITDLNASPGDAPYPLAADMAMIMLTGGTTGIPKLVPKTHGQYFLHAAASAKRCRLHENSVYLATLPAAHHFSMGCPGILGAFANAAKVVMAFTPAADEIFKLVEREGITIMPSVPPLLRAWCEARSWDESNLGSLELVQVGGGPIDSAAMRQARDMLGCHIQQAYGFTEGLVTYTDPADPYFYEDTQAQGCPLYKEDEVLIVDENDHELPAGVAGELIMRGPGLLTSYFHADPLLHPLWFTAQGYYRSGDLAMINEKGYLCILGRLKDILNKAGEKFSASEIENCLKKHPAVADAAVIGLPDEYLGEQVCACIIARDGMKKPALRDLQSFLLTDGIAAFKLPDRIEYLDKWPLTAVGKISKPALTDMVRQNV